MGHVTSPSVKPNQIKCIISNSELVYFQMLTHQKPLLQAGVEKKDDIFYSGNCNPSKSLSNLNCILSKTFNSTQLTQLELYLKQNFSGAGDSCFWSLLILFFLIFPFDPPENIRKQKIFWCFWRDQKGTLVRKRVKDGISYPMALKQKNVLISLRNRTIVNNLTNRNQSDLVKVYYRSSSPEVLL